MDRLEERLEIAAKAYATLSEILANDVPSTVRRDAAIIRDHNLSAHIWNEELAQQLFSRLPGHVRVLATWLEAMRRRVGR